MISQSIYWVLVLYLHWKIYHDKQNNEETITEFEPSKLLFYVMKISNINGVCAGVGLSVVYWTIMNDGSSDYNGDAKTMFLISNIFAHGLNAVLIMIDFFLSLSIYRYRDVWVLMLYAGTYQLFNLIFIISGGKDDEGNNYLYTNIKL